MNRHVRWIIVLLANLILIFLVAELNHSLAIWSLHVYLGGLFLTFSSLHLSLKQGLLATGATGLMLDSTNPLPFGSTFILLLVCHVVVFSLRGNFARSNLRTEVAIALSLNLVLMLSYGLLAAGDTPSPSIYWTRIAWEFLFSLVGVALFAPWFFAFQRMALGFFGVDLEVETRETP
jgi:uncharacterized membrane protein